MAFKLVISDTKTGKSVQKELADDAGKSFMGLKIGDSVKGETIDLQGYEFEITGGSDYCGFPMRKDVQGTGRKKILSYQGAGFRKDRKGMLQRKTVCGNTIHSQTAQINAKVVKQGKENIFEAKKEGEEKKEEGKPAEEKKEKPSGKPESKEAKKEEPQKSLRSPKPRKSRKKSPRSPRRSRPAASPRRSPKPRKSRKKRSSPEPLLISSKKTIPAPKAIN